MARIFRKTLILLIVAYFFAQNTGISYLSGTAMVRTDTLRPLAFKHISAKKIDLKQFWYDSDNNIESFTSVFTISEGYFYSEQKPVGHCRVSVNSKCVSINLCGGLKVYDEFLHKGLGSEILTMTFLHAKEQAIEKGVNPKWAVVFYEWDYQDSELAKANPAKYSEEVVMSPAKTMLEELGFTWMEGKREEIGQLGTHYRGHWAKIFWDFSESELRGINSLSENDKSILSIGISTMGNAEIEMAKRLQSRKIIATTIYKAGITKVQERIDESGITKEQIQVKLEDITKEKMPYENDTFDFIYARMALPYLTKTKLGNSLKEIYRVLKPGGRLYFAGRSTKDWEYNLPGAYTDRLTGQTTYPRTVHVDDALTISRIFFSNDSLMRYLLSASFEIIEPPRMFSESLFCDFERTIPVPKNSTLIDIVVKKPITKVSSAGNTKLLNISMPSKSYKKEKKLAIRKLLSGIAGAGRLERVSEKGSQYLVKSFNSTNSPIKREAISRILEYQGVLNTRIIKGGWRPKGYRLILCNIEGSDKKILLYSNRIMEEIVVVGNKYYAGHSLESKKKIGLIGGALRNLPRLRDIDIICATVNKDNTHNIKQIDDQELKDKLNNSRLLKRWALDFLKTSTFLDKDGGFTQSLILWFPEITKKGTIVGGTVVGLNPLSVDDLSKNRLRLNSPVKMRTKLSDKLVGRISRYYFQNGKCYIDLKSLEQLMSVCDDYRILLKPFRKVAMGREVKPEDFQREYEDYLIDMLRNKPWEPTLHGMILSICAENMTRRALDILLDILEEYFIDNTQTPLTEVNALVLIATIGGLIQDHQTVRIAEMLKDEIVFNQDIALLLMGILHKYGYKGHIMALELRSGQLESMYSHVKKVNEHRFLTLLLNEYKRLVKPKSAEPKIDINKARPYVIKLLLAGNYDITERIMEERNKQPLKDLYDLRMRIPELTIELLSGLMPHLSDKFVFGATEKDISIISTANPTADYKELNKTTEIAKSTKRVLLDFDALRAISYAA